MTIAEAIAKTDALKPNSYTTEEKTRWLSELDARMVNEFREWYSDCGEINQTWFEWLDGAGSTFFTSGYNYLNAATTYLFVPFPYDEMYVAWLEAMIDYANSEYAKYNNSVAFFEAKYNEFRNRINRTLTHKKQNIEYIPRAEGSVLPEELRT